MRQQRDKKNRGMEEERDEGTKGYSNKERTEQRDAKDQRDDGTKEWRTQI